MNFRLLLEAIAQLPFDSERMGGYDLFSYDLVNWATENSEILKEAKELSEEEKDHIAEILR